MGSEMCIRDSPRTCKTIDFAADSTFQARASQPEGQQASAQAPEHVKQSILQQIPPSRQGPANRKAAWSVESAAESLVLLRTGACADACWPSGWLAPAWRVESAGLPVGWPLPGGWNLLLNRSFYSGPGLALMLAGLPVGWPLPGGWNLQHQ